DTCQAGVCSGGNAVVCPAPDQCHTAGACAPATGVCSNPQKANGTVCNDGTLCTSGDVCQAGVCAGGNAVVCAMPDQCHDAGVCTGANPIACVAPDTCHDQGICNPVNGVCSFPVKADGTVCSDGTACTTSDVCESGSCVGIPVVCPPPSQCVNPGACNPLNG